MYKLNKHGVIRLSDGAYIPNCEDNRHWQGYQQWLKEGNNPEPDDSPTEEDIKKQSRINELERLLTDSDYKEFKYNRELRSKVITQTEYNKLIKEFDKQRQEWVNEINTLKGEGV